MCPGIAPAQASNLANRPVHGTPENLYQVGHMHMPASILLLGQLEASALSGWLALVLSAVLTVIALVQHFRPNPPNHDRFARRDELSGLSNKLDQLLRDNSAHYEKIMEAGSIRARTMYQKIDGVFDEVRKIDSRVSHLEGRIGVISHGKD